MPKTIEKEIIRVTVNIERRPISERQKRLWRAWWWHLILSVREELANEEKNRNAEPLPRERA